MSGPRWREEAVARLNADLSEWIEQIPPHRKLSYTDIIHAAHFIFDTNSEMEANHG